MNPRPDDPKGAAGSKKCPLHLIPPHALREIAEVMSLGGSKYGIFNWRHNNVCASTYVAAIMRHTSSWWDGELNDPESLRSHLAHVAASAIIVMDAMDQGTLNLDLPQDNRKVVEGATNPTEKDTTIPVNGEPRYRMLGHGDVLEEGDEWMDHDGSWYKTMCAGQPLGEMIPLYPYRRLIREEEPGYRMLKAGEMIEEGDEYFSSADSMWVKSLRVGCYTASCNQHRRPLKPDA